MNEITLTKAACEKILDIIIDEQNLNLKLRMFVQGGGCFGFQYGFTLDEIANDDDFIIEQSDIKILVDSISYQYLIGAEVDYEESMYGSQFVIKNPNATTTCGCGSSFDI